MSEVLEAEVNIESGTKAEPVEDNTATVTETPVTESGENDTESLPEAGSVDVTKTMEDNAETETETESPKDMVIRVRDLYKIYRTGETVVKALNGVSFDIDRGVFCSVVGASGSGKSTLLNMLAGLEPSTKGEIVIAGQHIENMNESQLVTFRRQHVGFIFQSYNLMPTMNSVENVALPLAFRGMDKKTRNRKAEEMLELVGLGRYKGNLPSQMSGGQQQRVGIARALVLDPEIVFADEPTGNLDSKTSEEVMNLMQKIVEEKHQTLIMVTHDDHLASYADIMIRISDGKIIENIDNRKRDTNWIEYFR